MGTPERTDIPEVHTLPDLAGQHVVIIGAGYLGSMVARFLAAAGARVTATTRSGLAPQAVQTSQPAQAMPGPPTSQTSQTSPGGAAVTYVPLDVYAIGDRLRDADAIVYAVAPRDGDQTAAFVEGPARVCEASSAPLVFVSSTSVYTSNDGGWVDETSPTTGVLADTERLLLARPKTAIVRCGGLYGAARSPLEWLRDEARRARSSQGAPDAWMNWVRVEDAASAIVAALAMRSCGPFNIAHAPVRRADFYGCAAEIAGVPPLTFTGETKGLGKRCATVRATTKLGWWPAYLDYRDGLSTLASAVVE